MGLVGKIYMHVGAGRNPCNDGQRGSSTVAAEHGDPMKLGRRRLIRRGTMRIFGRSREEEEVQEAGGTQRHMNSAARCDRN
jgi:hypothetical protein